MNDVRNYKGIFLVYSVENATVIIVHMFHT